jgi:hypothetical protein
MKGQLRHRFWFEAALTSVSMLLFVTTLVTREWIEATTGWDPDHGSGALEWAIAAVLLVTTLAFGLVARTEWRRPAPAGVPLQGA